MTTFYFMGSEIPGFLPSDSAVNEVATSEAVPGDSFCRAKTQAIAGSHVIVPALPDLDEFWMKVFITRQTGAGITSKTIVFVDNTDLEVLALNTTNGTSQVQIKVAGVWTDLGSSFTVAWYNQVQECDFYLDAQASGTFKIYIAGTERFAYTGDLSTCDNIAEIRGYGADTIGAYAYHGCVVSDEPTIGGRLATFYPLAAGSDTAWAGGPTSVDELAHIDVDFISSDTANQVETFTLTGPDLTGYTVRAVGVCARARTDGSGPTQIQLVLRSAGTNYFSASQTLDVGFISHLKVWQDNPATSVPFLVSEIAGLQAGVKSIA